MPLLVKETAFSIAASVTLRVKAGSADPCMRRFILISGSAERARATQEGGAR
jgi:hypothetical protein